MLYPRCGLSRIKCGPTYAYCARSHSTSFHRAALTPQGGGVTLQTAQGGVTAQMQPGETTARDPASTGAMLCSSSDAESMETGHAAAPAAQLGKAKRGPKPTNRDFLVRPVLVGVVRDRLGGGLLLTSLRRPLVLVHVVP